MGPLLLVLVVVIGAVIWAKTPNEDVWSYQPVPIVGSAALDLPESIPVGVGSVAAGSVSRYLAENGRESVATLVAEPDNQGHPSGTAVRVDLTTSEKAFTVGYLPEDLSAVVSKMVVDNSFQGIRSTALARIEGGESEPPNFRVWIEAQ